MVKIVIENLAQKEVFPEGKVNSVLSVLQSNYIDWMHACGGKGRCTTCKMIVIAGADQLSPLSAAELNYRKLGELASNERLACQTSVFGVCKIRVPDDTKMPHMTYTN
ncbi:MAG: (2Fe-2S)-binding protein [Cyclobacteriaceae bacterium]|nr:(2Fe-2S)-binding protein [Cyclobacteriaceae bacterium]